MLEFFVYYLLQRKFLMINVLFSLIQLTTNDVERLKQATKKETPTVISPILVRIERKHKIKMQCFKCDQMSTGSVRLVFTIYRMLVF